MNATILTKMASHINENLDLFKPNINGYFEENVNDFLVEILKNINFFLKV